MPYKDKYALITGASMGLGRCFALEMARRGINTILVSLPCEELREVAREARGYGTCSVCYEMDIADKNDLQSLAEWLNERYDIFILVNNAGRGGSQSMLDCDMEYLDELIQLNITAPSLLIHQLLPNLVRQDEAYILNISSMAAFSPTGYKTVYPASKRFMRHFSQGLAQELREHGVHVCVVHPGPMKTNSEVTERIERQGVLGHLGLLTPEKVARQSVSRLLRNDRTVFPGVSNKVNWFMLQLIPLPLRLSLMTRAVHRELTVNT